jgi:hypothetical protein
MDSSKKDQAEAKFLAFARRVGAFPTSALVAGDGACVPERRVTVEPGTKALQAARTMVGGLPTPNPARVQRVATRLQRLVNLENATSVSGRKRTRESA